MPRNYCVERIGSRFATAAPHGATGYGLLFASRSLPQRLDNAAKTVEQRGIEHPAPSAPRVVNGRVNDADQATQDDERRRDVSASEDVVEHALARAIEAELEERNAGWEARVAVLASELGARRWARSGVAPLRGRTNRRG
jgi:hypothetical protein